MFSRTISRRRFVLGTATVASLASVSHAFANQAATPAVTTPIPVVGSFSIITDWLTNVGGDRITATSIVPAGGDAHTFDPDPSVVATISDAKGIFSMGGGFEPWLADLISASGNSAPMLAVNDHFTLMPGGEHDHEEEGDHADEGDDHDHEHEGGDPHIWGDVKNAITAVGLIKDTLTEIDAEGASGYAEQADAYISELTDLDAWIREEITKIPEDRRKLVTPHDTFGYYAKAYGLEVIGTALGSVTTETADPSAKDIATLVDEIKASGVPAIFAENVVNPDLIQSIADEAGVELAPGLYSDALGEAGSDGDSYVKMMKFNTNTIVTALSA